MLYLIEKGYIIFWFFSFPIFGLLVQRRFSKTTIKSVLIIVGLLFIPKLVGYQYVMPFLYELLFFIALVFFYALYSELASWMKALSISAVLFLGLGFVIGFLSMMGVIKVEREWEIENYKVEYIRDQGFSGGPLMSYKLSKIASIPIFIKELEVVIDRDTLNSCDIDFYESNLTFNKCERKIIKNDP
jgi:hypothetical protein